MGVVSQVWNEPPVCFSHLILVSVVSLITEVAGPSFLQLDLFFFFFKNTNVLKISHKWANTMHGSLNQLTCQV